MDVHHAREPAIHGVECESLLPGGIEGDEMAREVIGHPVQSAP